MVGLLKKVELAQGVSVTHGLPCLARAASLGQSAILFLYKYHKNKEIIQISNPISVSFNPFCCRIRPPGRERVMPLGKLIYFTTVYQYTLALHAINLHFTLPSLHCHTVHCAL